MAKKDRFKPLFGGFDRLQGFPLDSNSVFETWAELNDYLVSSIAYDGQIIVCLEEAHYGAYIVKDRTFSQDSGHSGAKIFFPYKLYGGEEFEKQVGLLAQDLLEIRTRLATSSDEEIQTLQETLAKAEAWIKAANENGELEGEAKFATKAQLTELSNEIAAELTRMWGPEITEKLDRIDSYRGTINSIYAFIRDYGEDFQNAINANRSQIETLSNRANAHDASIATLFNNLADTVYRVAELERRYAQLDEHESRLDSAEEKISSIEENIQTVEHFAEYEITSDSLINGPVFNTNMVIKQVEITITETGENVQGGIFDITNEDISSRTTLSLDFVSSTNPSTPADTVIESSDIYLASDFKLIFDTEYQPIYDGQLRFSARHSLGMRGKAYVKYYEKIIPDDPTYSITLTPISHMTIIGEGVYRGNEQVTLEFIPDEGYYINLAPNSGHVYIGGRYYFVRLENGRYLLTFPMPEADIDGITVVGLQAREIVEEPIEENGGE